MTESNATVQRDERQHRYVLQVDGKPRGFAAYEEEDDRVIFTHTEVDGSLEGQGLGSKLVREALDDVRQRGKRIVPVCSFIAAYVQRHPEWNDLID